MPNPSSPPEFNKTVIAARAEALLPKFRDVIANISPEAGFGGIWESEMFLFFTAVHPFAPRQILESGRARGKSTLVLARCFPEARIVSVERERGTANAAAAEEKLRQCNNVELVYGDSRQVLPERLQPGDAVLIDGPKDFRGVELALELLHTGKPCAVFVHDFPPGSPWRKLVERQIPAAFFGDDPLFERFRILDQGRDPRTTGAAEKTGAYGIFACFPPGLPKPYWRLRLALMAARFAILL
jgi:predicted O-methyltransferase YrrM